MLAVVTEVAVTRRGPLIVAALVVLLGLAPLLTVGGLVGTFAGAAMTSFALALAVSLLVALVVTPSLAVFLLGFFLTAVVPFSLAIAGVFLNRKNLILLLMCVELLLLAANFNFIAFSRYLSDIDGQVFVFFILTVAAAESAIGLAILVVLFRERRSISVEDLNTLKG